MKPPSPKISPNLLYKMRGLHIDDPTFSLKKKPYRSLAYVNE